MENIAWQLIVPLKPAALAKSRLAADPELARAIAWDTVVAATRARHVMRVLVATSDPIYKERFAALPEVEMVEEAEPQGIASAVALGLAIIGTDAVARGVLLGDLPSLTAADLDTALAAAERHNHTFVRDAEGSGTTLVTARSGMEQLAHFGEGSAERHAAAGLTDLSLDPTSTLRRDVDTAADLNAAVQLGVGEATQAALADATPLRD